jgi:hypothetical protein
VTVVAGPLMVEVSDDVMVAGTVVVTVTNDCDVVEEATATVLVATMVVVGRGRPKKQLQAWLTTESLAPKKGPGIGSLRFITAGATVVVVLWNI